MSSFFYTEVRLYTSVSKIRSKDEWLIALYSDVARDRKKEDTRSSPGSTPRVWDVSICCNLMNEQDSKIQREKEDNKDNEELYLPSDGQQSSEENQSYQQANKEDEIRHDLDHGNHQPKQQNVTNNSQQHRTAYTGKLGTREPISGKKCVPTSIWHQYVPTTCNILHEINPRNGIILESSLEENENVDSMPPSIANDDTFRMKYLFHGSNREAWLLQQNNNNNNPPIILKTLRYMRDYYSSMYHHHTIDALATERLTHSPYIIDIYGYCGTSALNEYADGGDFWRVIRKTKKNVVTPLQKLVFARDAALGLRDIHDVGDDDEESDRHGTTLIHGDIRSPNFLLVGDQLKIHDFNQAKLLKWDTSKHRTCGYTFYGNCETDPTVNVNHRAPEECRKPKVRVYESVEVYHLGALFFKILTGSHAYQFEPEGNDRPLSEVLDWVLDKNRIPKFPPEIEESTDEATKQLVHIIRMAMAHKPSDRPTAKALAERLILVTEKIMKERDG